MLTKESSRYVVPKSRYKLEVFGVRADVRNHVPRLRRFPASLEPSGTFHGTRPDDLDVRIDISRWDHRFRPCFQTTRCPQIWSDYFPGNSIGRADCRLAELHDPPFSSRSRYSFESPFSRVSNLFQSLGSGAFKMDIRRHWFFRIDVVQIMWSFFALLLCMLIGLSMVLYSFCIVTYIE